MKIARNAWTFVLCTTYSPAVLPPLWCFDRLSASLCMLVYSSKITTLFRPLAATCVFLDSDVDRPVDYLLCCTSTQRWPRRRWTVCLRQRVRRLIGLSGQMRARVGVRRELIKSRCISAWLCVAARPCLLDDCWSSNPPPDNGRTRFPADGQPSKGVRALPISLRILFPSATGSPVFPAVPVRPITRRCNSVNIKHQ